MYAHDDETKQAFLDHLARTGVVSASCVHAGIKTATTVRKWRTDDEAFSEAYDEALATAADTLELTARQRAIEGVVRVKYTKDGHAYDEISYSDTLLLALLKAKKPHEYAERSKTEISNPDGTLGAANPEAAAARVMAMLEDAKRRRDADLDPLFG